MVGLKTKYQPCGTASDLGKNSSTFSVVRFDLVNSLAPLIGPIVDLKEGKSSRALTQLADFRNQTDLIFEARVFFESFSSLAQRT